MVTLRDDQNPFVQFHSDRADLVAGVDRYKIETENFSLDKIVERINEEESKLKTEEVQEAY